MKLVTAFIQPEKLNRVKQELFKADVHKMSVTNALGCGQQKGFHESYRGIDIEVNLLKKIRLEVAVNEKFLQPTVNAIIAGAKTGWIHWVSNYPAAETFSLKKWITFCRILTRQRRLQSS